MSRFYISPGSVAKDRVVVRGKELHHAKDVMRLKEGDAITVFDGTGKEYSGMIERVRKDELTAKILKVSHAGPERCMLTLIQAVPKSDRMDLIVEKATELGAARIIPVVTARTIVRPAGRTPKLERWRKIAVVAAKQCGRITVPEISSVIDFEDSLSYIRDHGISLMPCLHERNRTLKEVLRGKTADSAAVFIGPEGDFTASEVKDAVGAGAIPVFLGREVLRSETAAITVLSILNYELRW